MPPCREIGSAPEAGSDSSAGVATRLGIIVLAVAAAFLPALRCGFVNWDDAELVLECAEVRSLSGENLRRILAAPVAGAYLPARTICYAIDYAVAGGYRPFWFHLQSVVLHAVGALVSYALAARLAGARTGFAAALLFALHPTRVEGVAWVSGRKEVLVTLFCLCAALCFAISADMGASRPAKRNVRSLYYCAALCLSVLAAMSKATAVVLPLWLVLMDICFPSRLGRLRAADRALRHAPFFIIAAIFAYVHFLMGAASETIRSPGGFSPARQIALAALSPWWALRLLFWPVNLGALYHPELPRGLLAPKALLALAGCAVLAAAGVALLVKERGKWAFGYWWFFIGILPTANIIPTSTPIADRYVHLPGFGFAFASALALDWLVRQCGGDGWRRLAAASVLPLLVSGYAALSYRQCQTWEDSLSLWRQCLEAEPRNPLALANYALAQYSLAGRGAYAERLARLAVQTAPDLEFPLIALAQIQSARGDEAGAIVSYSKALVINPASRRATVGLASLFLKMNARRMAAGVCARYIEARPSAASDPEIRRILSQSGYSLPERRRNDPSGTADLAE